MFAASKSTAEQSSFVFSVIYGKDANLKRKDLVGKSVYALTDTNICAGR